MARPRGNGLRCSWFNRQPPSHRKIMLALVALLLTQASHATSFTAKSNLQKPHLSIPGGGGAGSSFLLTKKKTTKQTAATVGADMDMVASPGAMMRQERLSLLSNLGQNRKADTAASTATTTPTVVGAPPQELDNKVEAEEKEVKIPLSNIDIGTFWVHFCAAVTMTLPVMIVPMMDAELASTAGSAAAAMGLTRGASLAATMASMAPMGNGIGKLVNGLVCQQLGGPLSSKLYYVGSFLGSLALACLCLTPNAVGGGNLLSQFLTTDNLGWMVGTIEFCASIQWTVCSLFLSQYYKSQPALFARGITILALSSTGGQIIAKVVGALLLQFLHWRHVARLSVFTAISGFCVSAWTSRNMAKAMNAKTTTTTDDTEEENAPMLAQSQTSQSPAPADDNKISAGQAIRQILGSPVFWGIGLAHVSGYLTRTSDRILGSFLQEITSLSPQICGGLTAFMTVGFLYGLVTTSRKFHQQSAIQPKLQLLKKGYIRYLLSASGLIASAAFGKQWHPYFSASVITLCASIMASSIAFPFFQVPNMVSSIYFGPIKPVALSLIDGTGIVMTAPIWKIFNKFLLPRFGWSFSWSAAALIVGLCGTLLMRTIPGVLELQKQQQENSQDDTT